MVVSEQWKTWRHANTEKVICKIQIILEEAWWGQMKSFISICKPIANLLQCCDTDVRMMGDIDEGTYGTLENERPKVVQHHQGNTY